MFIVKILVYRAIDEPMETKFKLNGIVRGKVLYDKLENFLAVYRAGVDIVITYEQGKTKFSFQVPDDNYKCALLFLVHQIDGETLEIFDTNENCLERFV